MEPVQQLTNQYCQELRDDYNIIRMRTSLLRAEVAAQVERYQRKMTLLERRMKRGRGTMGATLTDMSPVDYEAGKLLKTFTWTAMLIIAVSMSKLLSAYLLSPVFALLMSRMTAFTLAFAILPIIITHYVYKPLDQVVWNDLLLRHVLLAFAICEGLLVGYILSHRTLSGSPPVASLTPLAISVGAQTCQSFIQNDRQKLFGATLGAGFAAHMTLTILLNFTFPYILLAAIYTAIGFIALQVFLKNVTEDTVFTHGYQLSMLYSTLVAQVLVYGLFGGDPAEMDK